MSNFKLLELKLQKKASGFQQVGPSAPSLSVPLGNSPSHSKMPNANGTPEEREEEELPKKHFKPEPKFKVNEKVFYFDKQARERCKTVIFELLDENSVKIVTEQNRTFTTSYQLSSQREK